MVLSRVSKPKVSLHDKKRHGQHHKSGGHYTKTYWPYLPMLLIVGMGFLCNLSWDAGKAVLGYATNVSAISLLQETNIQRSQNSVGALTLNNQLAVAAQAKAEDMAARNYWSHVTPDGVQPWKFISDAGYLYVIAAENLAYGFDSSNAAVIGWMNSPGHRANIVNSELREVGFGIANSATYQNNGEQTIIVAMYGKPQSVVTPSSAQYGTAPVVSARVGSPAPEQPKTITPTPTEAPSVAQQTPAAEPTEQEVLLAQPDTDKATATLQAREVSRIDMLAAGKAGWAAAGLALLTAVCCVIFFVRHARLWHRLLVRGEAFVMHHPAVDIAIVVVIVAGFILTRTTGFIH